MNNLRYSKGWILILAVAGLSAPGCAALTPPPVAEAAAVPALIPRPQQAMWKQGMTAIPAAAVSAPDGAPLARAALNRLLAEWNVPARADGGVPLRLTLGPVPEASSPAEAYRLTVSAQGVDVTAPEDLGLLRGVQTLRQLARPGAPPRLPWVTIADWPAFSVRGFMHDVGRNPQDVALLKRFLDVMAQYKLNVFHFHLTDNPGYRIECRVHPELNDPKFQPATRRPGFFYTYAQLNDLIAYAAARGIQVIPEIDMPGHSDYFPKTFGCDMQSEKGMRILQDVLAEFMDHVKTKYLHIGSDEVHLKNPAFLDTMADFIRSRGREVIVWRPGGLPKGRVITQGWAAGGKPSGPVGDNSWLDSRHNYINHFDPFEIPSRILNLAVCDQPAGDARALGGILCHWPDINAGTQENNYRTNPVFPALVAAAESYWTGGMPARKDLWGRLPRPDDPRFGPVADFERRLLAHRDAYFQDWPFPYVRQTDLPWKLIGPFPGDPATAFPVEKERRESYEIGGKTWTWTEALGATIHLNHFWYDGWLPKTNGGTAYALQNIWSPRAQTVGFWIGFNGPSRSDRRTAGPKAGQWSCSGGRIWVNGKEIPPPVWKQPGLGAAASETPFADEDYFYRPPTPVALRAGWNRILIKAPKTNADWKWMFTCVPVRVEGLRVREVEGLRFSAELQPAGGE